MAVFSNVQSNLEALEAVLRDAEAQGCGRAICLGDILGPGPDPLACMDRVRESCALTLAGDIDSTVQTFFAERDELSPDSHHAFAWLRAQVEPPRDPTLLQKQRWDWFKGLLSVAFQSQILFVHGTPAEPSRGFLNSESPAPAGAFDAFPGLCFHGQTRVPTVHFPGEDGRIILGHETIDVSTRKALIGVGAVGFPLGTDPRASWVLLEDGIVHFRKTPFDVDRTLDKFRSLSVLSPAFQAALRRGS